MSKIYKPIKYNKAIANPIYGHQWREIIDRKLQNLKQYSIWKYNKLPNRQVRINFKWVFKLKYHPNKSIARYKVKLVI